MFEWTGEYRVDGSQIEGTNRRTVDAVLWCGKGGVQSVVLVGIGDSLHLVEVEGIIAGQGAVQARLYEGRPIISEDVCASRIGFTHPSYSGVHRLAAVYELAGRLSEHEINKLAGLEAAHELRIIQPLGIVLVSAQHPTSTVLQVSLNYGRIGSGKVRWSAHKQLAVPCDNGSHVGTRIKRSLGHSLLDRGRFEAVHRPPGAERTEGVRSADVQPVLVDLQQHHIVPALLFALPFVHAHFLDVRWWRPNGFLQQLQVERESIQRVPGTRR